MLNEEGTNQLSLQRFSYEERPDLAARMDDADAGAFPEFLLHDPIWNGAWPRVISDFARFQFVLYDADRDSVVGAANAVPLRWDGSLEDLPAGTHAALQRAISEHERGVEPNTVCGVQAIATEEAKGTGLSDAFVRASPERAKEQGMEHSITPLRLLLKDRYPITPMAEYVEWRQDDGAPFDPWLRVWLRAGVELLGVCEDSLVIEGSVADWEAWTGIRFPASGEYVIPGGQVPLVVDRENDRGHYAEAHVWIEIPLGD